MLHVEPVTTAWLHFQRYVKRRAVTSCVCSCSFCYGQITGVVWFVVLRAGNKLILICGRVELSEEEGSMEFMRLQVLPLVISLFNCHCSESVSPVEMKNLL